MNNWLITNRDDLRPEGLEAVMATGKFTVWAEKADESAWLGEGDTWLAVDGYVLPRQPFPELLPHKDSRQLLLGLYREHGIHFIEFIKGMFVILLIDQERLYLFTDRMGLKKFFYYQQEDFFLFASSLALIAAHVPVSLAINHIALQCLFNNCIDSRTFLRDVFFSPPACRVTCDGGLLFDCYWHCDELLRVEQTALAFEDFAAAFASLIKTYIEFLQPGSIALTLTGGLDSRAILAALLHIGERPRTYTYGSPLSGDVKIARQLAATRDLQFTNHHVENPSAAWFGALAGEIVVCGNGITSIHRAHRLAAIKEQKRRFPDLEMVFTGHLGGESSRGVHYDGLIVSEFVSRFCADKAGNTELLRDCLRQNFIREQAVDPAELAAITERQRFFGQDRLQNQFFLLYLLEAGMHHAQDLHLMARSIRYPVPVYMDIDYLYLLYRSGNDFRSMYPGTKNPWRKVKRHELSCSLIKILAPELAGIPLAKRGAYSVDEYLGSKSLLLGKRFIRSATEGRPPPNFPLADWLVQYVEKMLAAIGKHDPANDVFDVAAAREAFAAAESHGQEERYWRRFTNIIFLHLLIKHYGAGCGP